MEYFEMVKPTYIENWPDGLLNHSISTVYFPLTKEESEALLNCHLINLESGHKVTPEEVRTLHRLEEKISTYIKQFPKGAFIRLGSRSPKDSWHGHREGFCCNTGAKAVNLLRDSERIYDDLWLAKSNNYTPYVVIREWIDIELWQEFRCFYKNRKLVGISQYNYLHHEVYPEIKENEGSIEWAIQIKSDIIKDLLPADDVVVDYIYKFKQRGNEVISEVILLECNPFMIYTDPCLFSWSKDKFDTLEFRYFKEEAPAQPESFNILSHPS